MRLPEAPRFATLPRVGETNEHDRGVMIAALWLGLAGLACDGEAEGAWPDEPLAASVAPRAAEAGGPPPNGKKLFDHETFDGNGRTCRTCHTEETGALSPAQVQAAYADDPTGPLFRAIDSDDRLGLSYDRLLTDATILVAMPLPPGWSLADDPSATEVLLARGVPTTMNVPSLDDLFMADARFETLEDQALGAIDAHAEPGRQPTLAELEAIAEFQQTNEFFSNNALKQWANGGPPPELPPGNTESEIRGREFFLPTPTGLCAFCHSGPMLDETSGFMPNPPLPAGVRVFTAFVSEFNRANLPVRTFLVDDGDGTTTVETPDPGRALVTGDLADVNLFRTPTIWGIEHTAPYFHDNSAADLEALMDHYADYFALAGFPITEQDEADIVAYMKLL